MSQNLADYMMNCNKLELEKFLISIIVVYLSKLQGGKFGKPTLDDLTDAGALHLFLENKAGKVSLETIQ